MSALKLVKYTVSSYAIGCDGDHLHLFVGAEPKHSPSVRQEVMP